MNKLRIAIYAATFALGSASAQAQVSPQDRAAQEAAGVKAAKEAKAATASGGLPTKGAKQIGDFPPYYGTSVKEWQAAQKRQSEREYQRLEKLTPKEQDEEFAERKRRQAEWQEMRPQENDPAK